MDTNNNNQMVAAPEVRKVKLMLHRGSAEVSRETVAAVTTPASTYSWTPISHIDLVEQVESVLANNRLKIVNQAHGLGHEGNRYFGLMQIQNGAAHDDYSWVLGLRNSHDKVFPAGLVAGMSVFVCDNLSFSGEVQFARKHTTRILYDLPFLTERAIGRLVEKWHHQDERIAAYKGAFIDDVNAHDIIIRATDVRALPPSQIPAVLQEWRKPQHAEFEESNLWSLFNSFTQVLKESSLNILPKRTEALHGLLDSYVGLN